MELNLINAREIESVSSWIPGGEAVATHIELYNFHNYNFDAQDSSIVSYRLFSIIEAGTAEVDGQQVQQHAKSIVTEGSVAVPYSIVEAWGEDDEPIFDYVIEQLGLVKVS